MKKVYMSPQTEVVDMRIATSLLAGSANGSNILSGDAGDGDVGLSREDEELLFGGPNSMIEQLLK